MAWTHSGSTIGPKRYSLARMRGGCSSSPSAKCAAGLTAAGRELVRRNAVVSKIKESERHRSSHKVRSRFSLTLSRVDFRAAASTSTACAPERSVPDRRLAADPRLRLFELTRELNQCRLVTIAPAEHHADRQTLSIPIERQRDRWLPGDVVNRARRRNKVYDLLVEQLRARTHEVDGADPE